MFELSNHGKKPFKHRRTKLTMMRDWLCIYVNVYTTKWSIICSNGDKIEHLFTSQVFDILELIKNPKHHILIYTNRIDVFADFMLFVSFYDRKGNNVTGFPRRPTDGEPDLSEAITDSYIIRDAIALSRDENFPSCDYMYNYIKSFGEEPHELKRSLASQASKNFYKTIKDVCWHDACEKGRHIDSKRTFDDLASGTSSGFLQILPKFCGKVINDVVSFDKSSAYPSKFVQLDDFPIGKIYCSYRDIKRLQECLDDDSWFTIVIDGRDGIHEKDMLRQYRSKHFDTIAVEKDDFKALYIYNEHGLKGLDTLYDLLSKRTWRIYFSDDNGYLLRDFRDRVVGEWYEKESSSTDFERKQHKMQLECIYGKGIQRFYGDYTDKDVSARYFRDGSKYVLPHWSRHVISSTRLELIRLWLDDSFYSIACDTDGIKYKNDDGVEQMFYDLNQYLIEKNSLSGYPDCGIGLWKKEYVAKRFKQIWKKQYLYETDDQIHLKISGFDLKNLSFFIGDEDPFTVIKKGISVPVHQGFWYDDTLDTIFDLQRKVVLGRNIKIPAL